MRNLFIFVLAAVSFNVSAQATCEQLLKPHFYDVTGSARTIGFGEIRTFSVISQVFRNHHSCNEALEFKRAQTGIAPKGGIDKHQYVSYEGECVPVVLCQ